MSSLKIPVDSRHIASDQMNEQVKNNDWVIMWLPKMLHKAPIEFFAVWTVAPSCCKNCIPSSHQLNLKKIMQALVHNILNLLY